MTVKTMDKFIQYAMIAANKLKLGREFRLAGRMRAALSYEEQGEHWLSDKAGQLGENEACEMVADLLLTVWECSLESDPQVLPEWMDIRGELNSAEYFLEKRLEAYILRQELEKQELPIVATPEELWAAVYDHEDFCIYVNASNNDVKQGWENFKELGYKYGFL